jgi:hypothetical protein
VHGGVTIYRGTRLRPVHMSRRTGRVPMTTTSPEGTGLATRLVATPDGVFAQAPLGSAD